MTPVPEQFPGRPEVRAGVASLDELQAERAALVEKMRFLRPLYGPFGMWDAQRKRHLALAELRARHDAAERQERITDKQADALAHTDADYMRFLDVSFVERAEYEVLAMKETALTERIKARDTDMRFVIAEMGLAR